MLRLHKTFLKIEHILSASIEIYILSITNFCYLFMTRLKLAAHKSIYIYYEEKLPKMAQSSIAMAQNGTKPKWELSLIHI